MKDKPRCLCHGREVMGDFKPLVILNFGSLFTKDLLAELEEDYTRSVIEHRIRLQLDHKKLVYPQVVQAVDRVDFSRLHGLVVLNLPADPVAAACLVVEFYARTGRHPSILEFQRAKGDPATLHVGTLRSLELEIHRTRERKAGIEIAVV